MDNQAVEQAIYSQLEARKKRVVNRNAISALFGAIANPVGALGKIFLGRADAIEAERQKIAQDVILELLCNIDEALSRALQSSSARGVTLGGFIETNGDAVDSVTGVQIDGNSGSVTLQPGTHIRTRQQGRNGLRVLESEASLLRSSLNGNQRVHRSPLPTLWDECGYLCICRRPGFLSWLRRPLGGFSWGSASDCHCERQLYQLRFPVRAAERRGWRSSMPELRRPDQ